MERVLSGKPVSSLLNTATKKLISEFSLSPTMQLIQVGSDPASAYYVESILSSGKKLGCTTNLLCLPETLSEAQLVDLISTANQDASIHGIMVQKPLPKHINDITINCALSPQKDLDCLHPENMGKIILEADGFLPCTPAAVYYMMRYYNVDPAGKNVVILGRSNVVGKPMANILLWKKAFANATITVCHSKTADISSITRKADIIISAIGKANFVTANMIKENSILFDVGINEIYNENGNTEYTGDIDYKACLDKALAITPVPGGVGRITTSALYLNLVKACLEQQGINKTIDEYIALIFNANTQDN